jgi:hypothetical protein
VERAVRQSALRQMPVNRLDAERQHGPIARCFPSETLNAFTKRCENRKRREGAHVLSTSRLAMASSLDEICNMVDESGRRNGAAPYASLKKVHVRKLRDLKADTPEAANFRLKQISALFTWAIKNDLATFNPAEKLEKLGGGSEGYYTWTDDDVEAFEAYWPVRSKPRLAMPIMLYLGVRRSDRF